MPSEHLYDYITSMELQRANNEAAEGGGSGGSGGTGSSSSSSSTDPANQDLYTQLAQKEQDLLLAAQLGKALLEKNEELSMLNEKMAEDYSKQLEVSRLFHPLPPLPPLTSSLPPSLPPSRHFHAFPNHLRLSHIIQPASHHQQIPPETK